MTAEVSAGSTHGCCGSECRHPEGRPGGTPQHTFCQLAVTQAVIISILHQHCHHHLLAHRSEKPVDIASFKHGWIQKLNNIPDDVSSSLDSVFPSVRFITLQRCGRESYCRSRCTSRQPSISGENALFHNFYPKFWADCRWSP